MAVRRIPEITAGQEDFRLVPVPGLGMTTARRDPVEPVPVGTLVARVFRVTGYDPDCDGSLMARVEAVDSAGEATGWETGRLGLRPGSWWIVDAPDELDRAAERIAP
jgi:hypothetical protein